MWNLLNKMPATDNVLLLFIIYICLYVAKSFCILFFVIQTVKYHRFTKNELHQQD